MTTSPHKELALKALYQMLGDDTVRARNAFRNCTPDQMKEKYGQSGKTREQIIAQYEAHDAKVNAAIEWLNEK